ncbi:MAG: hypothetical protein RSE23_01225, partial [Clostridia bacterium]
AVGVIAIWYWCKLSTVKEATKHMNKDNVTRIVKNPCKMRCQAPNPINSYDKQSCKQMKRKRGIVMKKLIAAVLMV